MMTYAQSRTALARMEAGLAETRHNLAFVEHRLCDGAEAETIRRRPKSRWYHRRMSRWTGADEAEYRRILDRMTDAAQAELEAASPQGRAAERRDSGVALQIPRQRRTAPAVRLVTVPADGCAGLCRHSREEERGPGFP
ncbi:hypothetical protein [Afifella pfennigii]|uniref:hypothetical protein n=1 Tax=Afifella pfennigii TaxID=209897 RepID=UPI000AFA0EEE|nr:hypothetical protein [Afifella pfennigii]